jgi:hypothetical protein
MMPQPTATTAAIVVTAALPKLICSHCSAAACLHPCLAMHNRSSCCTHLSCSTITAPEYTLLQMYSACTSGWNGTFTVSQGNTEPSTVVYPSRSAASIIAGVTQPPAGLNHLRLRPCCCCCCQAASSSSAAELSAARATWRADDSSLCVSSSSRVSCLGVRVYEWHVLLQQQQQQHYWCQADQHVTDMKG